MNHLFYFEKFMFFEISGVLCTNFLMFLFLLPSFLDTQNYMEDVKEVKFGINGP